MGLTVVEVVVSVVTILTVVYYWLVEHARGRRFQVDADGLLLLPQLVVTAVSFP